MPHLQDAYQVDIVLHMGMATTRAYYAIEKQAHRDGYHENKDVDGHVLPPDDGERIWPDCPPVLTTSLDFDDVFQRWRSNLSETAEAAPDLSDVDIQPSEDAGHFLCDFIYYSSLAENRRRKRHLSEDDLDQRPVLFLHVPANATAVQGKVVTEGLLRALAESWIIQKRRSCQDGI